MTRLEALMNDAMQCDYFEGDGLYMDNNHSVVPYPLGKQPKGFALVVEGYTDGPCSTKEERAAAWEEHLKKTEAGFVKLLAEWKIDPR